MSDPNLPVQAEDTVARVLPICGENAPASLIMQKDIAAALDIEPATVSQLLANMEQAGLIRRAEPLQRRRAECVSITEKGMI